MPNGLLIFKFPHSILWCRVDARGKNTLSTKFWLYIVQCGVWCGGVRGVFFIPQFCKRGRRRGAHAFTSPDLLQGLHRRLGPTSRKEQQEIYDPYQRMPLSIHSNYTITTYIQELDQGLVQHLSKCNTVGKRFNAFGSWADGQAIGWRVEATAATAYTPASISKWRWKSVLPTNLP